eukprot:COSAG05_NODE_7984_length_749_cov_0.958462_2_plen_37_part_01
MRLCADNLMFIHPQPFVSIPHVCVNGVWWILEQAVVF